MEYSIVKGIRIKSLIYLSDWYRYTKLNNNIYLQCTLAKQCNCLGLAKITTQKSLLEITKAHTVNWGDFGPKR